jgi:hypothetical protein
MGKGLYLLDLKGGTKNSGSWKISCHYLKTNDYTD